MVSIRNNKRTYPIGYVLFYAYFFSSAAMAICSGVMGSE